MKARVVVAFLLLLAVLDDLKEGVVRMYLLVLYSPRMGYYINILIRGRYRGKIASKAWFREELNG